MILWVLKKFCQALCLGLCCLRLLFSVVKSVLSSFAGYQKELPQEGVYTPPWCQCLPQAGTVLSVSLQSIRNVVPLDPEFYRHERDGRECDKTSVIFQLIHTWNRFYRRESWLCRNENHYSNYAGRVVIYKVFILAAPVELHFWIVFAFFTTTPLCTCGTVL